MNRVPRRHLRLGRDRAACGVPDPVRLTNDPAQVTCRACPKTIYMADREAALRAQQQNPRRKRRA